MVFRPPHRDGNTYPILYAKERLSKTIGGLDSIDVVSLCLTTGSTFECIGLNYVLQCQTRIQLFRGIPNLKQAPGPRSQPCHGPWRLIPKNTRGLILFTVMRLIEVGILMGPVPHAQTESTLKIPEVMAVVQRISSNIPRP